MPLILHLIGTNQYPILRIKAARFPICAAAAVDVMAVQFAAELLDVIAEESDDGTCIGDL